MKEAAGDGETMTRTCGASPAEECVSGVVATQLDRLHRAARRHFDDIHRPFAARSSKTVCGTNATLAGNPEKTRLCDGRGRGEGQNISLGVWGQVPPSVRDASSSIREGHLYPSSNMSALRLLLPQPTTRTLASRGTSSRMWCATSA